MKKKLVTMVLTVSVIWGIVGCGSAESTSMDGTTVPTEEIETEVTETEVAETEVTETEGEVTAEEILDAAHTEYLKQNYIIANWDYTDFQTGDTSHEEWVANRETQIALHAREDDKGELFVGDYCDFANGIQYYLMGKQYVMEDLTEGSEEVYDGTVFSPISRLVSIYTFGFGDDVVEGYENCYILTSEGYGSDFVVEHTYYIDKDTYRLEKYTSTVKDKDATGETEDALQTQEAWTYEYLDETSADWEAYNAILELPSEDICIGADEVAAYYE